MSTITRADRPRRATTGNAGAEIQSWWTPAMMGLLGAVVALLVGTDGSWSWAVVRIAVVLALTVGAISLWVAAGRAGAWAALLAGSLGLVVGIAFGLRYLALAGLSWKAAAGVLCLPAGLVLLTAGMRRVLRRRGPLASLGIGVGLTVVVALFVWTLTPAVLATNVPPIHHGASTPADYGMTAREVTFDAADGTALWAWYVPSQNGAALVLRHGAGSDASRVLPQAEVLARHGYGVLITDARGHGLSGGTAMDFGWYGDIDIGAAVSFLVSQPGVDPERIGVLGLSMGGEEALGAAAADPRIKAVVAEGATARSERDKVWFADVYGLRGRIQLVLEWAQYSLADLLTNASKPTVLADAVAHAGRPTFLITAGKAPDEGHTAEYLRERAPARVSTWTVPGAAHTGGLAADPQGWETTVIGFLDSALGP